MKSFLIIGMGNFGKHLAFKLQDLGNDVMIIDKNEKKISELANQFTDAYNGDCTNDAVIKSLGVNNFDVCYVTTGSNFQASLEITSLLKENGAKYIVAKATEDMQAKFLQQIGADEIVYPEKDIAEKIAIKHNASNVFDYIELGDDCALYELPVSSDWVGKSISDVDVRKNFHINVIAIKHNSTYEFATPTYVFDSNDHIMIIGKKNEVKATTKLIKKITKGK